MTKEELKIRAYELHDIALTTFTVNPVLLPEDTPPAVKSAWVRLFVQAGNDIAIVEKWLNEPD